MNKLEEYIYNKVINLHKNTNKEWIKLKEIFNEINLSSGKSVKYDESMIKTSIEKYCKTSDNFQQKEEIYLKEEGEESYKSIYFKNLKRIETIDIGEVFSRKEIMTLFKISGQSGIMKSKSLDCLVLTTSEDNAVYNDGVLSNGTIIYTGEGLNGDQKLIKNNKIIFESINTKISMYLFSKDNQKKYTFEGKVELYDNAFQMKEADKNNNIRLVWKFPLKVITEEASENKFCKDISIEIKQIENKLYEEYEAGELFFKEGLPNLRKFRSTGKKITRKMKPDYIAEHILKDTQGKINEKVIYEHELKRLMEEEANEQVEEMKKFFENKKENEGYDILSFEIDENGKYNRKYIEVKSTMGNESTPIDMTINEKKFAEENIKEYCVYRIVYSDSKDRYVKIINGEDLINKFDFQPVAFKIYLK